MTNFVDLNTATCSIDLTFLLTFLGLPQYWMVGPTSIGRNGCMYLCIFQLCMHYHKGKKEVWLVHFKYFDMGM